MTEHFLCLTSGQVLSHLILTATTELALSLAALHRFGSWGGREGVTHTAGFLVFPLRCPALPYSLPICISASPRTCRLGAAGTPPDRGCPDVMAVLNWVGGREAERFPAWILESLKFPLLTLMGCVTLGNLPDLSEPPFPSLWDWGDKGTNLMRLLWELSDMMPVKFKPKPYHLQTWFWASGMASVLPHS